MASIPGPPPSSTSSLRPRPGRPASTTELGAPPLAALGPKATGCTFDDALPPVAGARLIQAVLAALPNRAYARALVAPCGGGALAACLPAHRVVALDPGRALLAKAQRRLAQRADRGRFALLHGGLAELLPPPAGQAFDLVVLDGAREDLSALPPAALRLALDGQLAFGGILLAIERERHTLGPLPYTPLHRHALQFGDVALQLRCFWR